MNFDLAHWARVLFDEAVGRGWADVSAKPHTWVSISTKFSHGSSVAEASIKLLELIHPQHSEEETLALFTAAFLHDMGKEESYEDAKAHEFEPYKRKEEYEGFIRSSYNKLSIKDENGILQKLTNSYRLAVHGEPKSITEAVDKGILHSYDPRLSAILKVADGVVSAIENGEYSHAISRMNELELNGTYVTFTRIRGFSTQLLQEAVIKAFEAKGWALLVYTPSTLFFCSQRGTKNPNMEEVKSKLHELVNGLVKPESASRLVVGVYGQTPWIFIKEILPKIEDHGAIWDRIFIQAQGVAKRTIKSKGAQIPEGKDGEFYLRLSVPLIYLFRLPSAIAEEFETTSLSEAKNLQWKLSTILGQELGIEERLTRRLSTLTWTAPVSKKVLTVKEFLEATQHKYEGLFEALEINNFEKIEKIIKVAFAKASKGLITKADLKGDLFSLVDSLLEDVLDVGLEDNSRVTVENDLATYSQKIGKGTPVCPICAGKPSGNAISSVIGGGTESFSNMLVAGSFIKADNKIRSCEGCNFEGLLRTIYGRGRVGLNLLVFPQAIGNIRLAEYIAKKLTDSPLGLLQAFKEGSLPTNVTVGEKNVMSILEDAFGKEEGEGRQKVEDLLLELLEPDEEFNFDRAATLLQSDAKGEKLMEKEAKIASRLKEEIRRRYFSFNPRYFPGFTLIHSIGVRGRDDNETEASLKALTVALMLSKSLYGSVITQFDITPVYELNMRGATKAVKTTTLNFLDLPIERDGWVSYRNAKRLFEGLRAAKRLADMGRRYKVGVDSILQVLSIHPAVLYNRLSSSKKVSPITLLTLLERVSMCKRR